MSAPRKVSPDPLSALAANSPPTIPVRAFEASMAALDAHLGGDDSSLQARIRQLFGSDREARAVLKGIDKALSDPTAAAVRAAAIAEVLELLDDCEGDIADWKASARTEAERLTGLAAAVELVTGGLVEWSGRVTGLSVEETISVLRAMAALWLREAERLEGEGRIEPPRRGRPVPLMNRDRAVRVLRACGLTDRVARALIRAAQQ